MIPKIEIRVVHMCRPCAFSLLVITEGCYESSKTLLQSKSSRFCPIVSSSVKSIPIVCFSVQISSNKATMNSKLTNSLDRTCLWRSLDGVLLSGSNFVLEDLVHCQSFALLVNQEIPSRSSTQTQENKNQKNNKEDLTRSK